MTNILGALAKARSIEEKATQGPFITDAKGWGVLTSNGCVFAQCDEHNSFNDEQISDNENFITFSRNTYGAALNVIEASIQLLTTKVFSYPGFRGEDLPIEYRIVYEAIEAFAKSVEGKNEKENP